MSKEEILDELRFILSVLEQNSIWPNSKCHEDLKKIFFELKEQYGIKTN